VASSPAPAPLDKGKRVLEVFSDDEDFSGGIVFKRRRAARAPTPPTTSPQGGGSFRDNPPSATSPPPTTVQEEGGDGADWRAQDKNATSNTQALQVVSLQVQVTDLQDMAEASKELQEDLEDQCCAREERLEKMEGELATKVKALGLLRVDHDKLQTEVNRL